MTLSRQEYAAIISDGTKHIAGDIDWVGHPNAPARQFRVDVDSEADHPIFIKGWYNPNSGKLSYALIHRAMGRIHGLDLGADHCNPNGEYVGEKHKTIGFPVTGTSGPTCRMTLPRLGTGRWRCGGNSALR